MAPGEALVAEARPEGVGDAAGPVTARGVRGEGREGRGERGPVSTNKRGEGRTGLVAAASASPRRDREQDLEHGDEANLGKREGAGGVGRRWGGRGGLFNSASFSMHTLAHGCAESRYFPEGLERRHRRDAVEREIIHGPE